jgi:hypothetical protein
MFEKKFVKFLLCLAIISFSFVGARGANILFISAMDDTRQPSDDALKAFLEGLGHTVTYLDDDTPKLDMSTAAADADVVFISESVSSSKVNSKINEIATPMVVSEDWGWNEMGLATLTPGAAAEGVEAATTDIEIVAPGHPLAAGLTGTVPVLTTITGTGGTARFSTDTPGSKATVIAQATLSDGRTYDIIFVYEKGAELAQPPADGTPNKAADIRVCFGFEEERRAYLLWNENAYKLFEAAINFALGIRLQPKPYSPSPADGQLEVPRDTDLSWHKGMYAGNNNLYFGTDVNSVNEASVDNPLDVLVAQDKTDTDYDLSTLEYGTTYYWRVDEVNSTPDATVHKGDVWSFTTLNFIVVDDFEDYNDYQPDRIFDTWKDGFENPTINGAVVGYPDPDFEKFEHFIETSIINSGEQSMPYFYDNNMKYSEAFRLLEGSERNWTIDGVTSLALWHKGYPPYRGGFVEQPAGTYTVKATGADIWSNADQFHFVYKEVPGNSAVTFIAKVESLENINKDSKAGIMIRDSLEPGAINAALLLTPDTEKGLRFQYRKSTGGTTERATATDPNANLDPNAMAPYWLKFERTTGGIVRAFRSPDGKEDTWTRFPIQIVTMTAPTIYVGLAVTSHDVTQVCEARFSNVSFPDTSVSAQWADQDIGIMSNSTEPMYVALTSGSKTAVVYHDDPNAVHIEPWTEWSIPLQRFADQGINLSGVDKLAIGFGTRGDMTTPGGAGTMFFDDIRLYRP